VNAGAARTAAVLAALLVCAVVPPVQAQPVARCHASAAALVAVAEVSSRALPYFVEVELTLTNRTQESLRVDPSRFVLVPDQGRAVPAASREQVVLTVSNAPSASLWLFGFFTIGPVGVGVGVGPVDFWSRAVDARILRVGDLATGAGVRGSVYFRPEAWPARFAVSLEGITRPSGETLPPLVLRDCVLPVRPAVPPVTLSAPAQAARSVPLSARAQSGPISVTAARVELTRFATTLDVTVENAAEGDADLFVAIGGTHLVDEAGRTYAVRMLRSDLPDRVGPRGSVRGRLVFEPAPVDAAVLTLAMSGVRVAGADYAVTLDLLLHGR
jgi:hypothetical protein